MKFILPEIPMPDWDITISFSRDGMLFVHLVNPDVALVLEKHPATLYVRYDPNDDHYRWSISDRYKLDSIVLWLWAFAKANGLRMNPRYPFYVSGNHAGFRYVQEVDDKEQTE